MRVLDHPDELAEREHKLVANGDARDFECCLHTRLVSELRRLHQALTTNPRIKATTLISAAVPPHFAHTCSASLATATIRYGCRPRLLSFLLNFLSQPSTVVDEVFAALASSLCRSWFSSLPINNCASSGSLVTLEVYPDHLHSVSTAKDSLRKDTLASSPGIVA